MKPIVRTFLSRSHPWLWLTIVAAVLASSGCGSLTKSTYERPALDVPAAWGATPASVTGSEIAEREPWWRTFGDPQLDALIDRALRTNNDLAAAAMRLYSAQLQSQLTNTNLTPSVTTSASRSESRNFKNGSQSRRRCAPANRPGTGA